MQPLSPPQLSVRAIGSALVTAALVVASASATQAELDRNLCPKDGPPKRRTVLLVDTSDPLTAKHRSELERLVREMQTPDSTGNGPNLYVAPGEALIVYEMQAEWQNLKPVVHVCNPGGRPEEWKWWKGLYQGKLFAHRQWRQFEDRLKSLYPDKPREASSTSPILEALTVIVPRHTPSKRSRSGTGERPVHLILFSDLLQHSKRLSHYRRYPDARGFLDQPKLAELGTDLTHVRITLIRLERGQYSRWQTRDHYYWWTHLIREFNGELLWQESL